MIELWTHFKYKRSLLNLFRAKDWRDFILPASMEALSGLKVLFFFSTKIRSNFKPFEATILFIHPCQALFSKAIFYPHFTDGKEKCAITFVRPEGTEPATSLADGTQHTTGSRWITTISNLVCKLLNAEKCKEGIGTVVVWSLWRQPCHPASTVYAFNLLSDRQVLKPFLKVPCNLQPEEEEKWLREQLKAPLYVESFFFFFCMGFSESTHFSPTDWDFFF